MTVVKVPIGIARTAVTAVVALDLVALAAFAFHTTTTVTRTVTPLSQTAPGSRTAPLGVPQGGGAGGGSFTVPLSTGGGSNAVTVSTESKSKKTKPSTAPRHVKTPHHTSSKPAPKPSNPIPPIKDTELGTCPIKLAKPAQMGGVQSFVPFAPAFGPFSAEAFAAAAAYQPELELLGPILAQYPKIEPEVEPLMGPLLTLFGSGADTLYKLVSPLYAPHRSDVLKAETQLAAFFAPFSKQVAGQPLAGCVVDLEAVLVGDTKPGSSGKKSNGKESATTRRSGSSR